MTTNIITDACKTGIEKICLKFIFKHKYTHFNIHSDLLLSSGCFIIELTNAAHINYTQTCPHIDIYLLKKCMIDCYHVYNLY